MRSQDHALLAAMRQMVLDALAVPKPPLYTRVATIELKQPEADARLTPARWREVFPDDVDTTGWCEEDYEELTMIYSCAVDRRSGQKYVASATGLWKVLPTLLPVLGLPQLVCGSGGERRGKGHMDGAGAEAQMHGPFGSVVDKDGIVFLIDTNNHAVSLSLFLALFHLPPLFLSETCRLLCPETYSVENQLPPQSHVASHMLNAIIPRCGRLRPTARSRRLRVERWGTWTAWGVRRNSVCRWVFVWTRKAAPSMCQIAATTAFV